MHGFEHFLALSRYSFVQKSSKSHVRFSRYRVAEAQTSMNPLALIGVAERPTRRCMIGSPEKSKKNEKKL